jgi:osmotically inducible protein OsmC
MQRKASAVWQGGLKDGKGTISTDSGVLKQTQYSFSTRFENGVGTNPEELLAAAHAGVSPWRSAQLGNAGLTARNWRRRRRFRWRNSRTAAITKSHLDPSRNSGADKGKFDAAVGRETGCPVSKPFKAEISVNARLEPIRLGFTHAHRAGKQVQLRTIPAPGAAAGVAIF